MSHLIISGAAELEALQQVISHGDELLEAGTAAQFENRRRQLAALLENDDPNPFDFDLKKPVRTVFSREYKGDGAAAHQARAEVTFKWRLQRVADAAGNFAVQKGGVDVTYQRADGTALRTFHYDVCRGGMDEGGGVAHHPFAHFQYKGDPFADLPRLPTLIFTPADVLEQVLLDLWPQAWPRVASTVSSRSGLAKHYAGQRVRLEVCAARFIAVAKTAKQPLRGLQDRLVQDLAI